MHKINLDQTAIINPYQTKTSFSNIETTPILPSSRLQAPSIEASLRETSICLHKENKLILSFLTLTPLNKLEIKFKQTEIQKMSKNISVVSFDGAQASWFLG